MKLTQTPLAKTLVCRLATGVEHTKLKALAKEILADWDAVVACFYHPQLPPTNNEKVFLLTPKRRLNALGFNFWMH